MTATRVGVREFRARLAEYVASDEPVEVTRHGRTIGVFVSSNTDLTKARAALQESVRAVRDELEAAGVDAEDVAADFDEARHG